MLWFVYWLHGSPRHAIWSLKDATGVCSLNTGEFKGNSEIVTLTPSTDTAGNALPGVSAARSEPACCLVPASTPPQNLKHHNTNVGYLVFILKHCITRGGKSQNKYRIFLTIEPALIYATPK